MREIDLTKQTIEPCDEILLENGKLNFAWECWFDVDAYFGTKTMEDEDVWVNLYTEYHPETDRITAYFVIDSPNDSVVNDWEFTEDEMKFIKSKMEAYCKEEIRADWEDCENVLLTTYQFIGRTYEI